ncbi:cyclase family protein [Fodinisporobacter ferrooxydans]|uniref:Cyclase family protein n=1 Tax=Fodinisporobacter ferrooxydans TaxID=2901836 RepID=A0ABY4CTH4_9BACL|nr:cyclase family protein [Alicyclobacillaceae bacterium MYW30-H2]
MPWLQLSYRFKLDDPGWPGNPTMNYIPFSSISDGDDANTYTLSIFNHQGTHMDGPRHFNENGVTLSELPIDSFIFQQVELIDLPKDFGELVTVEDLEPYANRIANADLVLLRSGMWKKRDEDPFRYANEGPGVSAAACRYLAENYPNLRGIGMDWISLASYIHHSEGVLAHQWLLGKFHSHTLLIIEDMDLRYAKEGSVKKVIALPLLIEGIDSGPCTIVAEVD